MSQTAWYVYDYVMRDTDQDTGAVTLLLTYDASAGDKVKFQAHGNSDGSVSLTTTGTNVQILGKLP